MEIRKKKSKRSDHKVMTKEASILKFLRESRKISMRRAGELIGRSDTTISHAENGRLDITPQLIFSLLNVYGYSYEEFKKMMSPEFTVPEHDLAECIGILKRLDPKKIKTVRNILESF